MNIFFLVIHQRIVKFFFLVPVRRSVAVDGYLNFGDGATDPYQVGHNGVLDQ